MSQGKKHARLSASGSYRWLNCPGSVRLIDKAPPQPESKYALEGTLAHHVLECELKGISPTKPFTSEMATHAVNAAKLIRSYVTKNSTLLIEKKINLSPVAPDMFGTLDVAIVEEFGRLHVIDYKYGAGVAVSPINNTQLVYYSLGLAFEYDFNFTDVRHEIIQPRIETSDGFPKSWTIPVETLLDWEDKFRIGAVAALKKDAPLKAGSWCRFCPAVVICPEVTRNQLKSAQIDFAPENEIRPALPEPKDLTAKQIGTILAASHSLDAWISAVRSYAFEAMLRGVNIPGQKLVEKIPRTKWKDEAKASELAERDLGTGAFNLRTPGQLKKLAAEKGETAKWIEDLSEKVSSGLTIAPESDRRPVANPAALDFNKIDCDET